MYRALIREKCLKLSRVGKSDEIVTLASFLPPFEYMYNISGDRRTARQNIFKLRLCRRLPSLRRSKLCTTIRRYRVCQQRYCHCMEQSWRYGFPLMLFFVCHLSTCSLCPTTTLFQKAEDAEKSLELNGITLGNYPIRVTKSRTAIIPVNSAMLPKDEIERELCSRTIYVANIDKSVSQVLLLSLIFCLPLSFLLMFSTPPLADSLTAGIAHGTVVCIFSLRWTSNCFLSPCAAS